MPERLALMTSRSTASTCRREGARIGSGFLCHDQVLPFIDARALTRVNDRGAIELIEDGGSAQGQAHVEPLALIDRAFDIAPIEPHPPGVALRIGQLCASG